MTVAIAADSTAAMDLNDVTAQRSMPTTTVWQIISKSVSTFANASVALR